MPESEPERQDAFSSASSSAVAHADELYRHLTGLLAPELTEWLANWFAQPGWAVGYGFIRAGLHHFGGWALLAAEGRYVPCLAGLIQPAVIRYL